MKHAGKRFSVLISLLLALVTLFSLTAEAVDASDDFTVTKTAEWTDVDKTEADIKITETKVADSNDVPNILFVGTLCNAHDLDLDTLWTALATTASYGDVECYLIGNGYTAGTMERQYYAKIDMFPSTMDKLEDKVEAVKKIEAAYVTNTTKIISETATPTKTLGDITLVEGQHASVYDLGNFFAALSKAGKKVETL